MSKPAVTATQIIKVAENDFLSADDLLTAEEPLEIRLGFGEKEQRQQKNISVTMRTPGHDFELALGFLFTEGIIQKMEDVLAIKYCVGSGNESDVENIVRVELEENICPDLKNIERNFYTTSSCGVCGKTSIDALRIVCPDYRSANNIKVGTSLICSLPNELRKRQNIFEHTGGLHAAALFDLQGNCILLREDVGRHNALDKLIGAAMGLHILPLDNQILLLSGRASFELLQKSAMAGFKMVAAVGAPSGLAVQVAKEFHITLIGFLRAKSFNIYSSMERVVSESESINVRL